MSLGRLRPRRAVLTPKSITLFKIILSHVCNSETETVYLA